MASVSDRELAILRTWLCDDLRGMSWQAVLLAVTRPRSKGFSKLAYATFSLATARRLSPTYTRSDIVRFVVKARTDLRRLTGDFDPLLAEYVIVQSAGGKVSGTHGRMRQFYATLRLLRVLVADLELDREGIDQLLREGRALADEWLGQR